MAALLFVKALFKRWWALMSCAAFTFLGLYVTAENKSPLWVERVSFVIALVFLFLAAFLAWYDEHNSALGAQAIAKEAKERLDDLRTPNIIGHIAQIMWGDSDGRQFGSADTVTVMVVYSVIKNLGMDSVALGYRLSITLPDGRIIHPRNHQLPQTLTMDNTFLPDAANDALYNKTSRAPIIRGSSITGILMFVMEAPKQEIIPGSKLDLSFEDVTGKRNSILHTIGESEGKFMYIPGTNPPGIPPKAVK